MYVSTPDIIEKVKAVSPNGIQVSNGIGRLNSTSAIYYKKKVIFIFRMEDNFKFKKDYGYTEDEFLEEYLKYNWLIEDTIS